MALDARVQPEVEYTVDQLALVSGLTTRNIRAHQTRGLLPPPRVRGRTGYYGRRWSTILKDGVRRGG